MRNFFIMKKVLFIIAALCMCQPAFSQEAEKIKQVFPKNEIKINVPFFLLPGITYERLLSKNIGIGLSAEPSIQWGKDVYVDAGFHFRITPYSRYYYKAFFIEANAALSRLESKNKFGVGGALGCKFVSKKGFIGELYIRGGSFVDNMQGGYLIFGVAIGKQFQ